MRISCSISLAFVVSLLAVGCGSSQDSGPPHNMGGSGGTDDAQDFEDAAPEPGVCQPLCCSDADCAGLACKVFDSSYGTLGVCMPGTTGTGSGDATATFDQTCWTVNPPECNPFTNEQCDPGDACDVGGLGSDTQPSVSCYYGDNVQAQGETCDNVEGPYCLPGFHCVPNQ
jgi:hypothetical protein